MYRERFEEYLREYTGDEKKHCFSFVNHLCGYNFIHCFSDIDVVWHCTKVRESKLKLGDVIVLEDNSYKPHHFLFFVAKDIYLSQLGNGGRIVFTTLWEMMDLYNCSKFFRLECSHYAPCASSCSIYPSYEKIVSKFSSL